MNLEKITVELRYKKPAYPFTFRSKIVKQIIGSQPPSNKGLQIQEGIAIQINDKKAKLIIEPQRWALSVEHTNDRDELVAYLQSLYGKVYSAVQWKEGIRMGVRTSWLQEYENSFDSFVASFKQKLFSENQLVNDSADIGLPLTYYDGKNRVNFVAGPMTKEELQNRFEDKEKELPEVALFVELDYITTAEQEYDKAYFRKILTTALNYAEKKANQTEQELL